MKKAGARAALELLIEGAPLEDSSVAALGRLNYWCYIDGYEPLVELFSEPRIHQMHLDFIRSIDGG